MLAIAGILLLGVGGAVGWFAAKRGTNTSEHGTPPTKTEQGTPPEKPVIYYRAGDKDLVAPAPSWKEWKYPESRVHNSSTGGGATVGEIEFGSADRVALVTPDDFDKVWAFYKEKCKLRDPGDAGSTVRFEGGGNVQAVRVKIFDDVRAHSLEGPKSESVQARAFSVQSLRYSLIGLVYWPKGGDSTCILLLYRPNTEFIGLLKEKLVKE
jgi:hypothetical protein